MATVESDKYGLYIRVGGNIVRPECDAEHMSPQIPLKVYEGDMVSARNLGNGYVQVTTKDKPIKMAFWFVHGRYKDALDERSECYWNPSTATYTIDSTASPTQQDMLPPDRLEGEVSVGSELLASLDGLGDKLDSAPTVTPVKQLAKFTVRVSLDIHIEVLEE